MKDSNSNLRNASPPGFEEKDVEILNPETQLWEFYTLVKGMYRLSGNRYEPGWAKVGGGGAYSREELNAMYRAETLRVVDPGQYMDLTDDRSVTPRKVAMKRIETKQRHKKRFDRWMSDLDEMVRIDYEIGEESGDNDRIRAEMAGLQDYRLTFEYDDMEPGAPLFKLVFFSRSAFAGSAPYYLSDNEQSARIAAGQIAFRSGMPMQGRLGRDAVSGAGMCLGTIEARKKSRKDLNEFVQFVREITGFTGTITIDELGESAEREILSQFGVRDTPARSAA